MTDPVRKYFTLPVDSIPPEEGHFAVITERARRRRMRAAGTLAATVLFLGGVATGTAVVVKDSSGDRLTVSGQHTPGQTPTVESPVPASSHPPASPGPGTPSGSGGTGVVAALGLPAGGPVPNGFHVLSSTTTSHGLTYQLGTAPCASPPCTAVVRTDGSRWRGISAPAIDIAGGDRSDSRDTVRDLRFGTPRDGWAYGGALWSTHDGGATWRAVDAGGAVTDLASDGTRTYAVVSSCGAAGCTQRLRSTPVGRDAWEDVAGVSGAGSTGRVSVGSGTVAVSFGAGSVHIRDGGSWSKTPDVCGGTAPMVVASASSARVFVLCADAGAGSLDFTVRYTDDRGGTWYDVPAGPAGLRLANGPFVSATAASSAVLVAASGSPDLGGQVMISRDGGETWQVSDGGLPDRSSAAAGGWRYVGASSRNRIVALAATPDATYWVSHDGGRTWSAVKPG
jgi:hypothetical protein